MSILKNLKDPRIGMLCLFYLFGFLGFIKVTAIIQENEQAIESCFFDLVKAPHVWSSKLLCWFPS